MLTLQEYFNRCEARLLKDYTEVKNIQVEYFVDSKEEWESMTTAARGVVYRFMGLHDCVDQDKWKEYIDTVMVPELEQ
jgi:hypothetical protein